MPSKNDWYERSFQNLCCSLWKYFSWTLLASSLVENIFQIPWTLIARKIWKIREIYFQFIFWQIHFTNKIGIIRFCMFIWRLSVYFALKFGKFLLRLNYFFAENFSSKVLDEALFFYFLGVESSPNNVRNWTKFVPNWKKNVPKPMGTKTVCEKNNSISTKTCYKSNKKCYKNEKKMFANENCFTFNRKVTNWLFYVFTVVLYDPVWHRAIYSGLEWPFYGLVWYIMALLW